jgi:hypothetical protein
VSKKGDLKVCFYCERERDCKYTVFVHKAEYPMCSECCTEARKDSFIYAVRK